MYGRKGRKMTSEQEQMNILLKAGVRKAAADLVLHEVLLGIFNSYDYKDGEQIEAVFDVSEIKTIHKLFVIEYSEALKDFLSLGEQERSDTLDGYINYLRETFEQIRARDRP